MHRCPFCSWNSRRPTCPRVSETICVFISNQKRMRVYLCICVCVCTCAYLYVVNIVLIQYQPCMPPVFDQMSLQSFNINIHIKRQTHVHISACTYFHRAPVAPSGPTFNQPIIKPKNKMKVLHWHRILINKQTFDSTSHIWAEAWKNEDGDLKEQIKIDEEDFAYMFSATKAKSKKKANVDAGADADSGTEGQAATGDGKKTAGKKGKTVRLLVAKRFNAVCIGLRALPEPPVIFKAIRNLSTSRLSKEQLQTLQRISPTEAEIRAINASRASDDELGVAEKFIRDLSKIPMVSARIECWHFKVNFKEMIEQNSLPLLLIRKAVDAVVDSKALKQFLYVVLHCGNYMNGGTSRGQADAFDLGILTRIKGIRDTPGGSISLQQYICNVCVQSFGRDFGTRLENELSEALRAGSGNSMVFAGSQIASAAATVKRMKNLSLLVKSASDSAQDPFVTQMLAFNTVAADQIKQMKTRFEKTTKKVNDFFIYMNPNLSPNQLGQMKCEDVFHIMYNVVQDVSAGVTIYNDMHP